MFMMLLKFHLQSSQLTRANLRFLTTLRDAIVLFPIRISTLVSDFPSQYPKRALHFKTLLLVFCDDYAMEWGMGWNVLYD